MEHHGIFYWKTLYLYIYIYMAIFKSYVSHYQRVDARFWLLMLMVKMAQAAQTVPLSTIAHGLLPEVAAKRTIM